MVKKKVQREFVEVQVLCYKKNEERFIYKKKMVSFVTKFIIHDRQRGESVCGTSI